MVGTAQAFRQFADSQYQSRATQRAASQSSIGFWTAQQRDSARQQPQVTAAVIAQAVVCQAVLGLRSLLRLDQWLRTSGGRALIRSGGGPLGSDTTMLKALGAWDRARLRQASYAMHLALRDQGLCRTTLSSGKSVRLAIVDGTAMGGHRFSVLSFAGAVYQPVEVEPSRGRGHELADSRRLLARGVDAQRKLSSVGAAFLPRPVATEPVLSLPKEMSLPQQSGVGWEGLDEPLAVAWVRESALKGPRAGQTEAFWLLTTDVRLRAVELRELAHARWGIENLGLKASNAQVGSKLGYIRNARLKETLLLLWSWGLTLLGAWQWWLSQQAAWRAWGVRKTKALIGLVLTVTALGGEVSGCGGSP